MFKKLGTQITVITAAMVIVMVAVLLVSTLLQFRVYNDDILVERANTGVGVLEAEFDNNRSDLKKEFEIFTGDHAFMEAVANGDMSCIEQMCGKELDSKRNFLVVSDKAGNIVYKSSSYPFETFDIKQAVSTTIDGVVVSDNEMVLMYASHSGDYIVSIGYVLNESTWLSDLKNTADCDLTVFNGNLRYQTTLGSNLIGTPMGEVIKKAVIDTGKEYAGQAVINNLPYYVASMPLR